MADLLSFYSSWPSLIILNKIGAKSNRLNFNLITQFFEIAKMISENKKGWLINIMCFGWCIAVLTSYYFYSFGYYLEKLSVFGRYFLSALGY